MELRDKILRLINQHDPEMSATMIAYLFERMLIQAKQEWISEEARREIEILEKFRSENF